MKCLALTLLLCGSICIDVLCSCVLVQSGKNTPWVTRLGLCTCTRVYMYMYNLQCLNGMYTYMYNVHVYITCIICVYMCMHAWCTACEHDMAEGPASSPPCSLGSCAVRQSCRHSWVLPAALTPATSVTPGTSSPPRSPLSRSAHPTLSRPGGGGGGGGGVQVNVQCTCSTILL